MTSKGKQSSKSTTLEEDDRVITRGHMKILACLLSSLNSYYDGCIPQEVLHALDELSRAIYENDPASSKPRVQKMISEEVDAAIDELVQKMISEEVDASIDELRKKAKK